MHHEPARVYRAKDGYIHRQVAGAHVLISVGNNVANFNGYIELNESAALLWERLKSPASRQELERLLEETFGVPHSQAAEDVADFLKELLEHDMVVAS